MPEMVARERPQSLATHLLGLEVTLTGLGALGALIGLVCLGADTLTALVLAEANRTGLGCLGPGRDGPGTLVAWGLFGAFVATLGLGAEVGGR